MTIKTIVVPSDKFVNVRNIRINGKKYSCCDWWQYSEDNQAFEFNGELFCQGWYKKGITIFNKYQNELYRQF